jgi:hypothetical protein
MPYVTSYQASSLVISFVYSSNLIPIRRTGLENPVYLQGVIPIKGIAQCYTRGDVAIDPLTCQVERYTPVDDETKLIRPRDDKLQSSETEEVPYFLGPRCRRSGDKEKS